MAKYVEHIKVGTDEAWQIRDPDAHTSIEELNTTVDELNATVEDQSARLTSVEANITNLSSSKQDNLGFTPVQQGGGADQGNNKIYLGWNGGALTLQVDNVFQGVVLTQKSPWYASSGIYGVYGDSLPSNADVGRIFFKKV